MEIFGKKITIPLRYIILALLIGSIVYSLHEYFSTDDNKWLQLIGGLATGLILAFLHFLFDWKRFKDIENIQKLGVRRILSFRDDENFYREFILKAKSHIYVMGVTALRFMQDFADDSRDRPEKRVLLTCLDKGVVVKILVPKKEYLDESNKKKFEEVRVLFERTQGKNNNFSYRYFNHIPAHSIVIVDNECLLGPVFPNIQSKDTPCIQISLLNDFSPKYLTYFDYEWKNAQ